jgi:hypothetical protein
VFECIGEYLGRDQDHQKREQHLYK